MNFNNDPKWLLREDIYFWEIPPYSPPFPTSSLLHIKTVSQILSALLTIATGLI